MGKFDVKIENAGTEWKVALSGVQEEDAGLNPQNLAGAPAIELQLGAVKSINSCGIREWIKWMGTAGAVPVQYYKCPKIIVDQINMVQGFLPANGKVMSFYVPYYSDEAGTEKNILFTHGKEYGDQGLQEPPDVKDEGGNAMEMDVVEAKYFKFLKK